jgi:hypothetical protein
MWHILNKATPVHAPSGIESIELASNCEAQVYEIIAWEKKGQE